MKTTRLRWTPAAIIVLAGAAQSLAAGLFGAAFELSSLDGTNGFVINGIDELDFAGRSIASAGDFNGDGIHDLIIGAYMADPNGESEAGESYVVFGSNAPFPASIDLASLDGADGFVLNGIDAGDESGRTVSAAGDINNDGIDDLLIGAASANPNGLHSGQCYVVFGSASPFPASLELSTLDGVIGFRIDGLGSHDRLGRGVSAAGDFNGDGIDDLILGAPGVDKQIGQQFIQGSGATYVIFGSAAPFPVSFDLGSLDGTNGLAIIGIDMLDFSGQKISDAGDINGDGVDDLIIGAWHADPNGVANAGETYVVFGSAAPMPATLELAALNGSNGFVMNGVNEHDQNGYSVSAAGDINGDGIDDLVTGVFWADANGATEAGKTFVIFGSTLPFAASIDLDSLNGANGFALNGINSYDHSGSSASAAGDINGDGIDDLIVSAPQVDLNGLSNVGECYVIYGAQAPFPASIELSSLNGIDGFVLRGVDEADRFGQSVSSCDINNDGADDLIISAVLGDPNEVFAAGEVYVVFGRTPCPADLNSDGVVDTADLGILISQFGTTDPNADINDDGIVDTADLGILIATFGSTNCE